MKDILSRFLEYVAFDTESDENSPSAPSTAKQFQLAEFLKRELLAIGVVDVTLTDQCYLYGKLPATPGFEKVPPIGFIAHMDTSSAASGANIKPRIIDNWDGAPIPLGTGPLTVVPEASFKGNTIVTTDGTTLLGADDKAGIAVIVSAAEEIIAKNIPHGPLSFGFTPDEEIGRGADFFDVPFFGARYAYTIDGGSANEIEWENFNAASADITFKGVSIHPGGAKNIMINAQKLAMEFDAMLPAWEVPSHTAGREGFYHLTSSCGDVSNARLHYILRDHDAELFEKRKETILKITSYFNDKYGKGSVKAEIKESYRNMAEVMAKYPFLIEKAKNAIAAEGLIPVLPPIRGGTDGARLSFMGLPCPNLGSGAFRVHGETEYANINEMEKVIRILLHIVDSFVKEETETSH